MNLKLSHRKLSAVLTIGIFAIAIPISIKQLDREESFEDRTKAYDAAEIEIEAERLHQNTIARSNNTKNQSSTNNQPFISTNTPQIITSEIPPAYLNYKYQAYITIKNESPSDIFMEITSLPDEFTYSKICKQKQFLNKDKNFKCTISGTPTQASQQRIIVQVTNSKGLSTSKSYDLTIKPQKPNWLKNLLNIF